MLYYTSRNSFSPFLQPSVFEPIRHMRNAQATQRQYNKRSHPKLECTGGIWVWDNDNLEKLCDIRTHSDQHPQLVILLSSRVSWASLSSVFTCRRSSSSWPIELTLLNWFLSETPMGDWASEQVSGWRRGVRGAIQLEKKSSRKSSRKNFTSKSYNKKIKLDFRDDSHDDFRDYFFSIELGPWYKKAAYKNYIIQIVHIRKSVYCQKYLDI